MKDIVVYVAQTEFNGISEWRYLNGSKPNFFLARKRYQKDNVIKNFSARNSTARGAALELDKKLIKKGFKPIHILKPLQ